MRMQLDRRKFFRLAAWGMAFTCTVPRLKAIDEPSAVPIRREPVESKSIASIGFHSELKVLEIEFRSGGLYRYFSVPRSIFEALQKAESKGRYFSQSIRGKFKFKRLADVKP